MPSDEFTWIAQPADSKLTQKLNSKVSDMENSGYFLHDKEIIEKSTPESSEVVMLLHFKKDEKQAPHPDEFNDTEVAVVDIDDFDDNVSLESEIYDQKEPRARNLEDIRVDEVNRNLYLLFRDAYPSEEHWRK